MGTRIGWVGLSALLTACSGQVDYYSPAGDGGHWEAVGFTTVAPEPESATEGYELPGPSCDGHAACWPNGYCSDEGYCLPQSLTHCMVGGVLEDCTGLVCCDWGDGDHECAQAGDCAPDGEPL